jgi:hypothetical protein
VDVYANGSLLLDDLAYRSACRSLCGRFNIGVALKTASTRTTRWQISPNLFNGGTPLSSPMALSATRMRLFLIINTNAREFRRHGKNRPDFFHGGADAPNVDVDVILRRTTTLPTRLRGAAGY